ncbi:MAG: cyclic nucleotide-binding domain-containing protein [Desulfarculus sp.]|nr:MAG: cyclic nucleotide-binding domain-containing protein [Desulfarculus sp.]
MFIKEVELFQGLGSDFMGQVSEAAQERELPAGQVVFEQGQSADNFYILVEGGVELSIEQEGSIHFSLSTPGAVFGWSALVEPHTYTASAHCYTASKVLEIDRTRLEHILEKYPREALLVMKRLAGVVGQRLVKSYQELLRSRARSETPSYG